MTFHQTCEESLRLDANLIFPLPIGTDEDTDHWEVAHDELNKKDAEHRERWTGILNNQILFATLLSAVVGAFAVDSYKWLAPENPKVTRGLAIATNCLWFTALVLSLMATAIALRCQFILDDSHRHWARSNRDCMAIGQKLHNDLFTSGMRNIMLPGVPFLLQFAVAFFLSGLAIFLWDYSRPLSIILAVLLIIFYIPILTIGGLARQLLHVSSSAESQAIEYHDRVSRFGIQTPFFLFHPPSALKALQSKWMINAKVSDYPDIYTYIALVRLDRVCSVTPEVISTVVKCLWDPDFRPFADRCGKNRVETFAGQIGLVYGPRWDPQALRLISIIEILLGFHGRHLCRLQFLDLRIHAAELLLRILHVHPTCRFFNDDPNPVTSTFRSGDNGECSIVSNVLQDIFDAVVDRQAENPVSVHFRCAIVVAAISPFLARIHNPNIPLIFGLGVPALRMARDHLKVLLLEPLHVQTIRRYVRNKMSVSLNLNRMQLPIPHATVKDWRIQSKLLADGGVMNDSFAIFSEILSLLCEPDGAYEDDEQRWPEVVQTVREVALLP